MGILTIRKKWPQDHLVSITGIPTLVRWRLYIETPHWRQLKSQRYLVRLSAYFSDSGPLSLDLSQDEAHALLVDRRSTTLQTLSDGYYIYEQQDREAYMTQIETKRIHTTLQLHTFKLATVKKLFHIYIMFMGGHDDVIKWKHFPSYWPVCAGGLNSTHKGQWRGALMFL